MSSISPLSHNIVTQIAQRSVKEITVPTPPPPMREEVINVNNENDYYSKDAIIIGSKSDISHKIDEEWLKEQQAERGNELKRQLEKKIEPQWTSLRIRIDEETERIVIQVLNRENQIIRQIPPEEWLRFLSRWKEIQGLLFEEFA